MQNNTDAEILDFRLGMWILCMNWYLVKGGTKLLRIQMHLNHGPQKGA